MLRTWKKSKKVEKPVGNVKNIEKSSKILKNLEKIVKNVKKQEKPTKKIEFRQRGRKHEKPSKCRKPVKNCQKYRKIV